MAGQMAKAGIRATVRTNDWALLTKRIFNHQVNDITMIGWGDSNGDPESHNRLALQSGSTWSTTKDPHLDDLFARMSREMDPEKRKALMFEQQAYLRESFPMLYVAQMGLTVGLSQRLAWFEPRTDERYYFFTANGVK
jgi:ABC-type transport system substrate-binding protein